MPEKETEPGNDTMFVDCTTGEIDCLEGSSGNDTRTSGIRIEKKCPLNKTEATDNGIIKCDRTNASEDGSKPRPEYVAGDNSTRSFKLPLQPILVGIGAFVVVCIIVASARTLVRWSKGKGSIRNPDNIEANDATHSRDTNECVEMPETSVDMDASHDLENDYVKLQTREDSMMARKPITAIKSKHAESSLIYADLDIDHLQKACVVPIPGPRPNRRKEATVYDDIDFSKTKSAGPH
ncbi:hypothetical protein MAR_021919 [Mya arenaria]|uniref:Uncharacterized protein n=1 Tax=Mya arenaria TaxID=6604 RepID=A0ABY7EC09_MYAAR|nr:hypothetical protein MAR_021919 [Mya arenaria]